MTLTDVLSKVTLRMTSAQVVETSVNVISKSPSLGYTHIDDRTLLNYQFNCVRHARSAMFKSGLNYFGFRFVSTQL